MMGLFILLFGISILVNPHNEERDYILDFKDISNAAKIFIVVAFVTSVWLIGKSSFWANPITIDAVVNFLDNTWLGIGTFFLTLFILLENIMKRPFIHIKSKKIRQILFYLVLIIEIIICIYSFIY